MKWKKAIAIILCIIFVLFYIYYNQLYQISSVNLPWGIKRVRYIVDHSDYAYDLNHASEDDLRKQSYRSYDKSFGFVPNERSAVDIATIVLHELYGDCNGKEAPFVVVYNKNAEVWIVNGTRPFYIFRGTGTVAIKKETGEILLITHSK